jgi:hypothetical protein
MKRMFLFYDYLIGDFRFGGIGVSANLECPSGRGGQTGIIPIELAAAQRCFAKSLTDPQNALGSQYAPLGHPNDQ